jgi:hypothetical protein
MMKLKTPNLLRNLLIAWGIFAFFAVIGLFIYIFLHVTTGHTDIDTASASNVTFVLNKSGLWNHQVEKVLHSVDEPRAFDGSYLNAYAFRVSQLTVDDIKKTESRYSNNWYRGDQLPPVLKNVAKEVDDYRNYLNYDLSWLPEKSEIMSAGFYLYPLRISLQDSIESPRDFQIILVRPADKMVFYLGQARY